MDASNTEPMINRRHKRRPWYLNCLCCKEKDPSVTKIGGTSMVQTSNGLQYNNGMGLLMDNSNATDPSINSYNKGSSNPALKNLTSKGSYPTKQVFILGRKDKIVAKITETKVSKSPSNFSSLVSSSHASSEEEKDSMSPVKWTTKLLNQKHEVFSLWDRGIKADRLEEVTPEIIAKHIANRLKSDTVIDALCGFGGNAVQFAKYSNFVIGIDIEREKTESAKHNALVYDVGHKVDFLTADFLRIRNLSADVVFLAPSRNPQKPGEKFSLTKHICPDLTQLVIKSLEISRCIAIMLPGETDYEELAYFFNSALDKNELFSKRFCIEIEKIINTADEIEYVVIYFGDCSSIAEEDEYSSIYSYLAKNEPPEWTSKFPSTFVLKIIEKVGIRKSFKHISEIEERQKQDRKQSSIFELFLEKLINENLFTADAIKRIQDIESKRRIPQIPGRAYKKGTVDEIYESKNSKNTLSLPNTFTNKEVEDYSDPKTIKGTPFDPHFKNSHELSELAVSMYTVDDNYLNSQDYEDVFEKSMSQTDKDNAFLMKREDEPESLAGKERDLNMLVDELGLGDEKKSYDNDNEFEMTLKRRETGRSNLSSSGKKDSIAKEKQGRNSEITLK